MQSFSRITLALGLLTTMVMSQSAPAASPPAPTVITVQGMHCAMCAKKISGKLAGVPGVENVSAQVEAQRMIVIPRPEQAPAPRALWEAVERAGYRPVKLEGPSGAFTVKP